MSVQIHEIGEQFFLLRSQEKDFHRNIYLKRFVGNGAEINMVCDPGTKLDMPMLLEALDNLIGGVRNLHIVFLSHQDPDVSSNTPALLQLAPRSSLIASIDTWRLVKMYGIEERRFYGAESFKSAVLVVKGTGHRIRLVPAHYCHFRGALMFFDPASRVLFSGDLFGGLDTRKGDGIWADESSWEGISLFHQIYMPSRRAISATIDRIAMLAPAPLVIAPQHADVIKGELVTEFAARLAVLEVGVDVAAKPEAEKELLLLALNDALDSLRSRDAALHERVVQELQEPHGFTTLFTFTSRSLTDVKVASDDALAFLWKSLERIAPADVLPGLKAMLVTSLEQFSLSLSPSVLADAQEVDHPLADITQGESAFEAPSSGPRDQQ